jgi:hypothetical protein
MLFLVTYAVDFGLLGGYRFIVCIYKGYIDYISPTVAGWLDIDAGTDLFQGPSGRLAPGCLVTAEV